VAVWTSQSLSSLTERVAKRGSNELELLSLLDEAREQAFFRLFSIDMLANCAYLEGTPDECDFDACEILPVEPTPEVLSRDAAELDFDLDAWARLDPPSQDYYDLEQYPETYTAYNGSHVWHFVYDKLCFRAAAAREEKQRRDDAPLDDDALDDAAALDSALDSDFDDDDWRAVFDRAVSGVHASISCHVAEGYPDESAVQAEFDRRVGHHPDRVANVHFALAVVLTALREAKASLLAYDYDIQQGEDATKKTRNLAHRIATQPILDDDDLATVAATLREAGMMANECVLAVNQDKQFLEESGIWQMRQRSRAMLRLMDCIACGVCRLHGKVCWFGLATAFKLIYSDRRTKPLARVEVAALIVALEKLASSVRFINEMTNDDL